MATSLYHLLSTFLSSLCTCVRQVAAFPILARGTTAKPHVFLYIFASMVALYVSQSPELEFFKQSMGARNRVGIGLSYRPARPHKLAEFIPWNQFLGFINV